MRFNVLQASVRAYQRNLNTHSTYKGFREERAKLRDEGKPLDSMRLSEFLNKYAYLFKNSESLMLSKGLPSSLSLALSSLNPL